MSEKIKVKCPECDGMGGIPVCPDPRYDEWEECPVCEGHGGWVEEFDAQDLKHIIDDEYLDEMFKDYEVDEIKRNKERGYYD